MTRAEQELIAEIEQYKKMLGETQSKNRKWQLHRHIDKLYKELKTYRHLRYGN